MKKRILVSGIVLLMAMLVLVGCGDSATASNPSSDDDGIKFAIIFGVGGLGDNGFNDEVHQGVLMAVEKYGVSYDYAEPTDITEFETQLRMFADSGEYDTIISISSEQVDAIKMVAEDYPEQNFTMLDTLIEGYDNIRSLAASHPDQHFLSGMLAGLATQDDRFPLSNPNQNVVGFTIAMDTPTSRSQAAGFIAGAKYANPEVEVLTNFIGSYNDPVTAKELALVMYERGADVVSANAGSSTQGVFSAAEEVNRYVIGTSLAMADPKISLSTSVKKIWEFVVDDIGHLVNGTWEPGFVIQGLADGVTDYDIEGLDVEIPEDIIQILEDTRELVLKGELVLPQELNEVDEWASRNQLQR